MEVFPNEILVKILGFVFCNDKDWPFLISLQNVSQQWQKVTKYLFEKTFGHSVQVPAKLLRIDILRYNRWSFSLCIVVDGSIHVKHLPILLEYSIPGINRSNVVKIYHKDFPLSSRKTILWQSDFYLNSTLQKLHSFGKLFLYYKLKPKHKHPRLLFQPEAEKFVYKDIQNQIYILFQKNVQNNSNEQSLGVD